MQSSKDKKKNQNMWMVRAGHGSFLIDDFIKNNTVAIGWNLGDLSNASLDEVKEKLKEVYPDYDYRRINPRANNIIKFKDQINIGDYVISADSVNKIYYVGEITSDYIYNPYWPGYDFDDYADTRTVKWIGKVDKRDLDKNIKTYLSHQLTVFSIKEEVKNVILNKLGIETNTFTNFKEGGVILDSFYDYLINKGYFFDKEVVENYLLSLKVKPFVILTGNSGTGKTKLSQLFAEYLTEKSNNDIVVETDDEYLELEIPIGKRVSKYLKEGFLFLDKKVMRRVLPIDKIEGNLDIHFDNIKSNERIYTIISGDCKDKSLKNYFKKEAEESSSINIKINKNDINQTILDLTYSPDIIETKVKTGTIWLWNINKSVWKEFSPFKQYSKWRLIINNQQVTANIRLAFFRLDAKKSNNKELTDYLEKISNVNPRQEISLKLDFSTFVSEYEMNNEIEEDELSEEEITQEEPSKSKSKETELYKIIPVGANWTENRHILGYHNLMTGKDQTTPAYKLIEAAIEDDEPYFLILDEMNLSHVERYFADFLSAIESKKPIPLYGKKESLEIPENLFMVGTVNVDETTYMFSPKVLDRANTIEFETVKPEDYMNDNFNKSEFKGNYKYLQNPLSDDFEDKKLSEIKEEFKEVKINNEPFWDVLSNEITKFYEALKPAGFDFGFRVIDEVTKFMYVAWKYENKDNEFKNWERYFDAQIKQKLLPKLHGSEKVLGNTLKELLKLCEDESQEGKDPKYPTSHKKLKEMQKVLKTQRYVSFIN